MSAGTGVATVDGTGVGTGVRRRFAVVVRVGDGSLHPGWLAPDRDFDLVVDYYGSTPGRWAGTADLLLESKGSKWKGLHRVLAAHPHLRSDYEAVWFPDDDIATDAATIDAAFRLHVELGLGLSQPALTDDSYFTHLLTLAHPGLDVRWTNFVEVMVPIFSRQALQACWETFAESESGYGLDLVWQAVLPGLGLRSAVLDRLTVRHTRPVGGGTLYDGLVEQPAEEGARVARTHGVPTPMTFDVHEVLATDGRREHGAAAARAALEHLPVPVQQEIPEWDLYRADLRARSAATTADRPALRRTARLAPSRRTAPAPRRPDEPVVLLLGADPRAADRAAAWSSCGWGTRRVRDVRTLADELAVAEAHPLRAVDVRLDAVDELERAVVLAADAGAVVVVRVSPATLVCPHPPAAAGTSGRRGCTACATQWRTVAASASALVAESPALAARLRDLLPSGSEVLPALPLDDVRALAAVGTPAGVDPVTVLVLRRAGTDLRPLLRALAGQRGLAAPVDVLLVDEDGTPGSVPTPSPAGDAVRVRSHAGPPAVALAEEGRDARVLVLDAADVPSPWCVADHSRGADGPGADDDAVLSHARAHLGVDDAFTTGVLGARPGRRRGVRVSAPVATVVEAVRRSGAAHADAVAAAVGRLVPTRPLPCPTHTAPAMTDLEQEGRLVAEAATAAELVAPSPQPVDPAALVYWTHRAGSHAIILAKLATVDPGTLRAMVVDTRLGLRGHDLVALFLADALDAHATAAVLVVAAARRALRAGRPLVLAVDAADPRLLPTLTLLARGAAGREVDALGPDVVLLEVVRRPGDAGTDAAFLDGLLAAAAAVGVPGAPLPRVVVRTEPEPAVRLVGADLTLPVADQAWCPGLPVPLEGRPVGDWLDALVTLRSSELVPA